MRFFPCLTEKFYSSLPPAELLRRMRSNVEPSSSWRALVTGQPAYSFRGQIGSNSFKISRIPQGRGSMQPIIEGQVSTNSAGGGQLQLHYRLSWPTLLFAILYLSVTGTWVITELSQPIIGNGLVGALPLFCFGLLLFTIPFWWEVNESRQLLTYLLNLELLTA